MLTYGRMQSDTQTKLERDAYALALNTKNLKYIPVVDRDVLNKIPDSWKITRERQDILVKYDEDDDIPFHVEVDIRDIRLWSFCADGDSLEEAIQKLDDDISYWVHYHNVVTDRWLEVLHSPDGTLYHSNRDKTCFYVKFDTRMIALDYDIYTDEFYPSTKYDPILFCIKEGWKTGDSYLSRIGSPRELAKTLISLWNDQHDNVSKWRFIYPPFCPSLEGCTIHNYNTMTKPDGSSIFPWEMNCSCNPRRKLFKKDGTFFNLNDIGVDELCKKLENVQNVVNEYIPEWCPSMLSKIKP